MSADEQRLKQRIRELEIALDEIAFGKQHSGVIPCPQDYEFYIKPWRELARNVLANKDIA